MIGKQKIPYCAIQERAANITYCKFQEISRRLLGRLHIAIYYKYFHSLLRKGVSYMGPTIQNENNELISIVAKYIFQK